MSSSRIPLQRSDQLGGRRGGIKAFGAFARRQQETQPTVQKPKPVLLSNAGIVKRRKDAAAAYTLRQNGEPNINLGRLAFTQCVLQQCLQLNLPSWPGMQLEVLRRTKMLPWRTTIVYSMAIYLFRSATQGERWMRWLQRFFQGVAQYQYYISTG